MCEAVQRFQTLSENCCIPEENAATFDQIFVCVQYFTQA